MERLSNEGKSSASKEGENKREINQSVFDATIEQIVASFADKIPPALTAKDIVVREHALRRLVNVRKNTEQDLLKYLQGGKYPEADTAQEAAELYDRLLREQSK